MVAFKKAEFYRANSKNAAPKKKRSDVADCTSEGCNSKNIRDIDIHF